MGVFDGKAFMRTVSSAPGVYVMLDTSGKHLYIGKAGNLKKRLSSYFRSTGLSPKTAAMVTHIAHVDTIVTHTESEALLLENNLIKSHQPRYNVVLRDDKSYPYIRVAGDHAFPRLGFYRGSRKQPGRYFGPFPSAASVRSTLSQLQKMFPVRQCEDTYFRNRSRPCLQYQIGRCTAPCVNFIDAAEYKEDVDQVVLFLEGNDAALADHLVRQMEQASEQLNFEEAAKLRDRIACVRRVQEKQYVSGHRGDADIIAIEIAQDQACIEVAMIRKGRHLGNKQFFPVVSLELEHDEVLAAFLPQYYLERSAPPEIVTSHAIEGIALLEQTLCRQEKRRVQIKHSVRGHRSKWLQMAAINAQDSLRRFVAGRATHQRRLSELKEALSLHEMPRRIECFDISHTMGEKTVASCVVFGMDGAVKSDYRRFNINNITGGDDYAAMEQALTRRYTRIMDGEGSLPDVLLIDGGKGQLGVAERTLEKVGVQGVRIVGVAKGRARKAGMEKLFLYSGGRGKMLDASSPALHLIQQVRDEAHRFAITGHRQRRGAARTRSVLQDIEGVGEKRRQALLKQLGGMQQVLRAGVDDLAKVPGISSALAQRIYDELHSS